MQMHLTVMGSCRQTSHVFPAALVSLRRVSWTCFGSAVPYLPLFLQWMGALAGYLPSLESFIDALVSSSMLAGSLPFKPLGLQDLLLAPQTALEQFLQQIYVALSSSRWERAAWQGLPDAAPPDTVDGPQDMKSERERTLALTHPFASAPQCYDGQDQHPLLL